MSGGGHIPFGEYQQIDAVNMSTLLLMQLSPKHYKYGLEHPRADTMAYRRGRAAHTATLEPMQFLHGYCLSPYPDFRTQIARDWRDAQLASGKTVLTEEDYRVAERIRESVLRHKLARQLIIDGRHECTLTWTDPRTGIGCKGRFDYITDRALVDLKTTRHNTPRAFGREAARLHYHTRLAFYRDGIQAASGESLAVKIIAVENTPPHDCVVYDVPEDALLAGRKVYEGLLDTLVDCRRTGLWPGVSENLPLDLALPAWVLTDQDDEEQVLTIGGVPLAF